jgi:primosomal protein N' (replication factor Y)
MAMVYFSSRFREQLIKAISQVAGQLNKVIISNFESVRLLGPTPLGIEKKANQFTWAIMLKSEQINDLHGVISTFESNYKPIHNITYKVDIDPMHIL